MVAGAPPAPSRCLPCPAGCGVGAGAVEWRTRLAGGCSLPSAPAATAPQLPLPLTSPTLPRPLPLSPQLRLFPRELLRRITAKTLDTYYDREARPQ